MHRGQKSYINPMQRWDLHKPELGGGGGGGGK